MRNAPYRSVFGHGARIEFLLVLGGTRYLVEAKNMRVSGSMDEKLAFVLLNARHNRPDHEFVLVMDGKGWRPEARRWIATMARDEEGFHVVTPTGLKSWLLLNQPGTAGPVPALPAHTAPRSDRMHESGGYAQRGGRSSPGTVNWRTRNGPDQICCHAD